MSTLSPKVHLSRRKAADRLVFMSEAYQGSLALAQLTFMTNLLLMRSSQVHMAQTVSSLVSQALLT